MTTPFSDVYDKFLSLVKDYKLNMIYQLSESHVEFENYVFNWLIFGIRDFKKCDQSLSYTGTNFTATLTEKNILMLSQLMKKYWLEKEIDDILQMNDNLRDKDFDHYAASQNMKSKQDRMILEKEEISQLLLEYDLDYGVNWASWYAGNFYTP